MTTLTPQVRTDLIGKVQKMLLGGKHKSEIIGPLGEHIKGLGVPDYGDQADEIIKVAKVPNAVAPEEAKQQETPAAPAAAVADVTAAPVDYYAEVMRRLREDSSEKSVRTTKTWLMLQGMLPDEANVLIEKALAEVQPASVPVMEPVTAPAVAATPAVVQQSVAAQEPVLVGPDANGEFPTPVDGALWMASLGIPQTPLQKRTKKPFLDAWQDKATTNSEQIRKWATEYFGCNFGSVGKAGKHFVFEADSPDVRKRFEATGQTFSSRLIIQSRPNRGHRWYLYAPGVTNISQTYTKHGDFSLRADDMQCVSPGSIHPETGKQYVVTDAGAPAAPTQQEIDFWNSERIEKKSVTQDIARNERGLIPYGQHLYHGWLVQQAGKLRQMGLNVETIETSLIELAEKNLEPPIDFEKVKQVARSMRIYPAGQNTDLVLTQQAQTQNQQPNKADVSNWLSMFRSVEEMEDGPIVMVIEGVLQEGTCFIGANPGDGKTLAGLAFAKAISTGTPLFGLPQYAVTEPRTVIYLIPESRDRAFRKRCEAFRMPTDKMKFMARTISAGVSLELGDPYLLEAVRQTKAVVFLDTASRFMKGTDENAAAQNRQLVNDVVTLLAAGAICVVLIHHATKASKAKQEAMTLENMLRGSSDLGAMCDQAYGIRKDMLLYANGAGPMEIDLVNLKDREQIGELTSLRLAASYKKEGMDFPASYINEMGNFIVINNAETYRRNLETLVGLVKADPNIPVKELAVKTGLTEYAVKHSLLGLGWHRVQGGSGGASPWHQDSGDCLYAKAKPVKATGRRS